MHGPVRLILIALLIPGGACGRPADEAGETQLHVVRRGPLAITVRERGELRAARDQRVSSDLEGRNTLIYLIEEGSTVEAGEKLAELDASLIEEKRSSEAIAVAKARAALEQARKNVEIVEKELAAADKTAENRLLIAGMRAEKLLGQPVSSPTPSNGPIGGATAPGTNAGMITKLRELHAARAADQADGLIRDEALIDDLLALFGDEESLSRRMGEMANQILQSINEISLARSDLELTADTLSYSRKLFEKGFLTKNELDRDELAYQRQQGQHTLAWNNMTLLVRYTLPESVIATRQEIENAQLALESVRAAGEARRIREAAELVSAEAEFALAEARLANWTDQIEKAVLYAPSPGLVVYGRWDWDEPVFEGMEVRQRQEIVILPDVTQMVTDLKVHEAQIDKVAKGQPASIKVDAFPGKTFNGHVTEVSTLPDPAPSYRNDIKLYSVTVAMDLENRDGSLRPGMSATIEIDVGTLPDVLTVPLPAIERRGDEHFVWRAGAKGPIPVPVTLGSNNLTHVEILDGLSGDDRVHMARPPGAELPAEDAPSAAEPPSSGDVANRP